MKCELCEIQFKTEQKLLDHAIWHWMKSRGYKN